MDRFPLMLYRAGREVATDSGPMDVHVVADADALAAALADGWHETSPAAAEAVCAVLVDATPDQAPSDDAPPTRAELEQKAAELGIKIDGRWSEKRIASAIAEKLQG